MKVHTPEWVKHAVFYQIFPDRFARGGTNFHPPGIQLKPWGSDPQEQGFQGGDLYGVIQKLDYLQQLGITALYLNPIFSSASNHRYHTFDYMQVDPLLGGDAALRELLDKAHERGMRVVLDGVFNHASRGFWAFHHILETGGESPYIDWFHIEDWPLRAYHADEDNPPNYSAWWGLPALPKFNTKNPGVRQYLFDVAGYWLEFGIDGWRLDVPAEIDDDEFWREFRTLVKSTNGEAYICGEVWGKAKRWLKGDMFDATMNYVFCSATLSFFADQHLHADYKKNELPLRYLTSDEFCKIIDEMHASYDWAVNQVQLNLLGSHDMARPLWIMLEDKKALLQATLFQMTMPGAPCIYYGDEIGLSGGDDPDCRAAYPWHQPQVQDKRLLAQIKLAVRLRHAHPVLRTGDFQFIPTRDKDMIAFRRQLGLDIALVVFNRSPVARQFVTEEESWNTAFGQDDWSEVIDSQRYITLPGRETLVLIA